MLAIDYKQLYLHDVYSACTCAVLAASPQQHGWVRRWLVKYPHCTPITPSWRTKLWKDAATVRAIGMSNIANCHQGRWEGRNLNATFTELRRTGHEATKTELFEARAAKHHVRQHAGPAGRYLTDLNLPVLGANYVCSENSKISSLQTCYPITEN